MSTKKALETGDIATGPPGLKLLRPHPDPLVAMARHVQFARTRNARHFPREVFRDTAWDIMLELFVLARERRSVCVKQLTLGTSETPTGAIRRIDRLEEAKLIRRRLDPEDHRRVFVELTAKGDAAMAGLLNDMLAITPLATEDATARPEPRSFEARRP